MIRTMSRNVLAGVLALASILVPTAMLASAYALDRGISNCYGDWGDGQQSAYNWLVGASPFLAAVLVFCRNRHWRCWDVDALGAGNRARPYLSRGLRFRCVGDRLQRGRMRRLSMTTPRCRHTFASRLSSARPPPSPALQTAGSSRGRLRDRLVARQRRERDGHLQQRGERLRRRFDPSGDERLPAVGNHDHVTRLDVRRGMLDHARSSLVVSWRR